MPKALLAGVLLASALASARVAAAEPSASLVLEVRSSVTHGLIASAEVWLPDERNRRAESTGMGTFRADVTPGEHRIAVRAPGYALRIVRIAVAAPNTQLTIVLDPSFGATELPTIAVTTITAPRNDVTSGPALHTSLGAEDLARAGMFRLADALLTLPDANASANAAGSPAGSPGQGAQAGKIAQSTGPGSSIFFDLRGFGPIETSTLIDGHPIGQGIDLGYDFQDAPIFALQDVYIGYGSGANGAFGVNNAGGVIDMRTLDPTEQPSLRLLQGFGSYQRSTTALQATGNDPSGRFTYAFAYGVEGQDGWIAHDRQYVPAASFDPSTSDPAILDAATYVLDQSTVRRSALAKLGINLGAPTWLTLHALSNTSWEDGSGNSDNIYLPAPTALARGNQLLAAKTPSDPCPGGTFTALNPFGMPQGFGPTGAPDGGLTCQTPQQWASFNTGWQGIGPHFTTLHATDEGAHLTTASGPHSIALDLYDNDYYFDYDRTGFLPYFATPGDTGFAFDQLVGNVGGSLIDQIDLGDNTLGVGYRYDDETYRFRFLAGSVLRQSGVPDTVQNVGVRNGALSLEDQYQLNDARTTLQGWLVSTSSSATHTSFIDSHFGLRHEFGARDAVRFTAGSVTVQPPAAWLDNPFVPIALQGFNPTCGEPASVGSASIGSLGPERAADQELTYSHHFDPDSQVVVAAYNTLLDSKIYQTTVPLSALPPNFVSPALLGPYEAVLTATCGASNAGLGVTSYDNVGQVRARGFLLSATTHIGPATRIRLDWSGESDVLERADTPLLAANKTLILGGQLPNVPLHKASFAVEQRFSDAVDGALVYNWTGAGNPSNLPAYSFVNAQFSIGLPRGALHVIVNNLFDQWSGDRALIGQGTALPLSPLAQPGDYAPYVGIDATTEYPLAPRRVEVYYQIGVP
ncbi:MAG TPA: TonB-dependent receptor plug domain-containing protein [Candidatus Tyrphobacter sp.]